MAIARAVSKSAPIGSPSLEGVSLGGSATSAAPGSPKTARKPRSRAGAYGTAMRADQNRLAELKAKLGDPEYMNGAILRIATVLSARLTLR
jgi:hypothetical protein